MLSPPADFAPSASLAALRMRAEVLRRLRGFFEQRGFLEVETPLLSADTVVDRHIDPLPVIVFRDPRQPHVGRRMWLQTSPEFAMKRLLAAGASAIYQVTRSFRGGERGALHNPEFTIAEWYRVGDGLFEGMELLSDLTEALLERGPAERCSYRQAFLDHVGVDPHTASCAELVAAARQRTVAVPASFDADDRDSWLDLLLVECVEPDLGMDRPLILYDYPASQAALARVREAEVPVAERFELYWRGVELANGYHELLDADVLRRRNAAVNERRAAEGKYTLPEESRLLAAMDAGALPPCAGTALGVDRLVMLAFGAREISAILPFPLEKA